MYIFVPLDVNPVYTYDHFNHIRRNEEVDGATSSVRIIAILRTYNGS